MSFPFELFVPSISSGYNSFKNLVDFKMITLSPTSLNKSLILLGNLLIQILPSLTTLSSFYDKTGDSFFS